MPCVPETTISDFGASGGPTWASMVARLSPSGPFSGWVKITGETPALRQAAANFSLASAGVWEKWRGSRAVGMASA